MSFAHGLNNCKNQISLPSSCSLSGWLVLEYVVFSFFVWWLTYLYLVTLLRQNEEWNCRLLTFFHGSVAFYSAIRDITVREEMHLDLTPLSEDQRTYLSFMLSYFIFDLTWIRFFGNESWVIHFHHIASIIVIMKIILNDFGGLGVSVAVAGLEVTNPYLQIRWFLRTHGYLNKPVHTIVELWFFFWFYVIRIAGGSILFYFTLMCPDVDLFMKLLLTCIYIISWMLAWDIYKYVKKKYFTNQLGPTTASTSLDELEPQSEVPRHSKKNPDLVLRKKQSRPSRSSILEKNSFRRKSPKIKRF